MKIYSLIFFLFFYFTLQLSAQYHSVLSSGNWYSFSTNVNGVYKLDYNDFFELGVNLDYVEIEDIKIYGNGGGMLPHLNSNFRHDDLIQISIEIHDFNNNGVFENGDYVLFYGESPNEWILNEDNGYFEHQVHLFSDNVKYYLTINNNITSKRIALKQPLGNSTRIINTFTDFAYHESELENLIQSGRKWFGERFDYQNNQSFDFEFPNIETTTPININLGVVARSLSNSSFILKINEELLNSINIANVSSSFAAEYAKEANSSINYISSSKNISISLEYSSLDNGSSAWLDYITINAKRKLKMVGNSMIFRNIDNLSAEIGRFDLEDAEGCTVWDVTNSSDVCRMQSSISNNGTLTFKDSLNTLHEYISFNNSSFLAPSLIGKISNQDLHNLSSDIEYVIISHPDFISASNRLSDFHFSQDGLKSVVVTPQQIYNEFSSGMQDVTAIRDFLRMLYKRPESQLKYLLLFGDGSYDPKNRIPNNTNYIPTYQSDNSTHPIFSYVTDDYFGLLDDDEGLFINDLVDIGIGRLPVSSISEANIMVDKIQQYYAKESFGSWRNDVVFIADDGDAKDGNTHMWQADSLSNYVADHYPDINIAKIYLDNYLQESTPGGPRSEATQEAINNKVEKGALLVNYTGHGGQLGWTQERILEIDQINSWKNKNLPLFMTATCKFSYFDDPEKQSAGEYLLLNKEGGAIALLSTTRLVYSSPNYNLNTKFINILFEKINGNSPRLGDVFKQTKILSGTAMNNRNFTLLGDPALRLAQPSLSIETTFMPDTLKALSTVTIDGSVVDKYGNLASSFNGTVFPTVLDKEIIRTTLGQESCTPMPYRDQNNILYKGSASVVNGVFSFSFVVPKDIAYNYGNGKISYYAYSEESNPTDASGSDKSFVIGGTSDNIEYYDNDGPEISLYMNTESFVDGGITDNNPILIADISDFSGINTVGNGIGHDITAILNGNTVSPFVLNEYYEAEKDNYQRGRVRFPLFDLENGQHTITLKVWDVFNNSSEETINFIVSDEQFQIAEYTCFPNPAVNSTDFYFQHNKSNQDLNVNLDIYSINGLLVRTISEKYFDQGYALGPINWDGKNNNMELVAAGVYIAQLRLVSSDGDFTSKSIQLILLPN